MSRSTTGTLLGAATAGAVAWALGGALGVGVLGGFLLGASLSGFGVAWQRHLARTRPDKLLAASVATFLFKLGVLVAAALVLRFVEPAALRADWRAFLVAFGAAVALIVPLGSLDALRTLRGRGLVRRGEMA